MKAQSKLEQSINQYETIQKNRINSLIASIEEKTGKMFHEYDSLFYARCRDAKSFHDNAQVIDLLTKRLDRLNGVQS